jgi:dTDP-4-amino-4,6-dideoxygalactose transaminase
VTETLIPIARPRFGPDEESAVLEVMRSGAFAQGERVRAFEDAFAKETGARFAIASSNGSTALYLALRASGIGPGDEVITTPLTFIATANAIMHTGARPVFADVDDTLNLDPAAAARAIGPHTKALLPVHLHGNPANLSALTSLARQHNLLLIQDACQAIGATIDGQRLGAFGTAVYSFYATKNLTTGEGGMVITNDPEIARICASLRHQAYGAAPYSHDAVAFNFRMTELQAAIGLVQLKKLSALTERRRAIADFYDDVIAENGLRRPRVLPGANHVYHQYTLRVTPSAHLTRDQVRERLLALGIATGIYYPVPIHHQPAYGDFNDVSCPQAEQAADDMLSIPVYSSLTDEERDRVARAVSEL